MADVRLLRAGRGAMVVGALLVSVGLALDYVAAVALGVGAMATTAIAFVSVRRGPDLDVHLDVYPPRVSVGDVAHIRVRVHNRSRRRPRALIAAIETGNDVVEVDLPAMGRGTISTEIRVPTARRARLLCGPVSVRRHDALELAESTTTWGQRVPVWVRPRHIDVPALPAGRVRHLEAPQVGTPARGSSTFDALRDYANGDDPRFIHWRASARTGSLVVRQMVDLSLPSTSVVVDNRSDVHTAETLDTSVEIAASVLHAATRRGYDGRLSVVATPRPSEADVGALDALAEVEVADADVATVEALLGRIERTGSLVFVTGNAQQSEIDRIGASAAGFGRTVLVCVGGDRRLRAHSRAVLCVDSIEDFVVTWGASIGHWSR